MLVRSTTDKRKIYALLQRDPIYGAYAIGDLEPELAAWCSWHVAEYDGQVVALVLSYRRLEPPVLLTLGDPAGVAAIFEQAPLPRCVYMNALAPHLSVFQSRYDFSGDRVRPMLRMVVSPETFRAVGEPGDRASAVRRLGPADVPAIEALFAEGGAFAPDAFSAAQVGEGVFYGLEIFRSHLFPPFLRGKGLVSVAGTHLVAPAMGVAAVGNIYTHPAHRNRGYGKLVTSAVTAELLSRGLQVVLNVDQGNDAAIHIYQELGYRIHGPFVEGIGVKRGNSQ